MLGMAYVRPDGAHGLLMPVICLPSSLSSACPSDSGMGPPVSVHLEGTPLLVVTPSPQRGPLRGGLLTTGTAACLQLRPGPRRAQGGTPRRPLLITPSRGRFRAGQSRRVTAVVCCHSSWGHHTSDVCSPPPGLGVGGRLLCASVMTVSRTGYVGSWPV